MSIEKHTSNLGQQDSGISFGNCILQNFCLQGSRTKLYENSAIFFIKKFSSVYLGR